MAAVAWHKVAEASELPDGTIKACSAGGVDVVLTRVGDRYGAVASRCPHAGGPLADATLEDGHLICPWHGREYDPVSGACEGYAESVRAYPVEVRDGAVYVGI